MYALRPILKARPLHARQRRSHAARGFTLIEMLIVLALIAILSTIILAILRSAREDANVASMLHDFKQIERSLILMADNHNLATWWRDDAIPGGSGNPNPTIAALAEGELGIHLPVVPNSPLGAAYHYDNDGDAFSCGGDSSQGVLLFLADVERSSVFDKADDITDAGDGPDCGVIRRTTGSPYQLIYMISADQKY